MGVVLTVQAILDLLFKCQCFCHLFSLLNMACLNQTRIGSLNAEALMISDIIGPNWQQKSEPIVSNKQSGILLLRKNMKLVINYA